jgi:hypothetical protein
VGWGWVAQRLKASGSIQNVTQYLILEGQISSEPLKKLGKMFRISLNEYNATTHLVPV